MDTEATPIEVDAPEKKTRARRAPKPVNAKTGWHKIVLQDSDNIPPTGLPIGINGTFYHMRPGEEVSVPPAVLEVLNHAVETVPVKDPDTDKIVGSRQRMRYPYQLVQ